jgi:hypothetical protein
MAELNATFDVKQFEYYGTNSSYLSEEQLTRVESVQDRVNSQLDWLAQLLGWSGDYYWGNLPNNVEQKRKLLRGSFGFYNGYIYPEIVEVRNWSDTVIIKADDRILGNATFYLGDKSYIPVSLTEEEDKYVVTFENLPEEFYEDLAIFGQLRIISRKAIGSPFYRPFPETSGDARFICGLDGSSLSLYPSYDTAKSLPYIFNTLIKGSRYYFDKPVSLVVSSTQTVSPEYDFPTESWYIDVPDDFSSSEVGLSAVLTYDTYSLTVSLLQWKDPSDWMNEDSINNFRGVWNAKGGRLPFNFVFDSLGIHGFDERKSVKLDEIVREIPFDNLLDFVYYQKAHVSATPPPSREHSNQVWWNTQSGAFSVYQGDYLNCGPWVEIDYPSLNNRDSGVDYIFPDVSSFVSASPNLPEGHLVRICEISGLSSSDGVAGLSGNLVGPGQIEIYRKEGSPYWTPLNFSFEKVPDFSANSEKLPERVPVTIQDSSGLGPENTNYKISNLQFEIEEKMELSLMKDFSNGKWFIKPPNFLRYIGNTRLFESSQDFLNPVEGELNWDFSDTEVSTRSARVFNYSRWVLNPLTLEWALEGDWVEINSNDSLSGVTNSIDFGAIKVYCDGELLPENEKYQSETFQFSYSVNGTTGNFIFTYIPLSYQGTVKLPSVTISDSLTSAFTHDISNLVFSGLRYHMSPNVADCETLLRIWKSEKLKVIDSLDELELLRSENPLRADVNTGPSDENWERYFIRLSPTYGRNDAVWQKVNLICQNFGYWGSALNPEFMKRSSELPAPRIYEAVHAYGGKPDSPVHLYSEPYLYSTVVRNLGISSDFDNSCILPTFEQPFDDFTEASVIPYDPLHNRHADKTSPVGRGFGNWDGSYYRASFYRELSGFLSKDLKEEVLEEISDPIWDASILKIPPLRLVENPSSTVDSNHYKVGYAFFAADLSAAGDGVFDLGVAA